MNAKFHEVTTINAENDFLFLVVDGQAYRIQWENCSPRLAQASPAERAYIEASPSGYGLHWPLLDEDLAITPLLKKAAVVPQEIA